MTGEEAETHSPADDVVLITGAAGPDIGRATARAFLAQGAAVAITDRSERRVNEVAGEFAEEFGAERVTGQVLDLRYPETYGDVFNSITDVIGSPTVLVNNAAVTKIIGLDEMTMADWDEVQSVNVRAPWLLSQLVVPEMKRKGYGSIINVSSVAVYSPGWLEGHYSVSKAGLNGLTRELACEFGPFGIRCNTVAPGMLDSKFIRDHWDRYGPYVEKTPIRRFPKPSEIAAIITFLASPAASAITGEVVNATGGWYMPA